MNYKSFQEHEESIKERLLKQKGKVGFYYKNLIEETSMAYNECELFRAASIIKLPVFIELLRQGELGSVNLEQKIKIRKKEMVPSCGALNLFHEEPEVTIKTLCNFMIALSDNTAANVLIDLLGIEKLNRGFREFGIQKTRLERKLFDMEAAAKGLENKFMPLEIAQLFEAIYLKRLISNKVSLKAEEILRKQQINHKIPGKLLEQIEVAHKTGEADGISNDAGIVYWEKPFVIVFASNDTDVVEFEQLIREITYEFSIGRTY